MSQGSNSAENVRLNAPTPGGMTNVAAGTAGQVLLNFEPSQVTEIQQNDTGLTFVFENGGKATIDGFFEFESGAAPEFVFPGDIVVSAADFLSVYDFELVEPASGGQSGGLGEYNDDAGALVDALNALDPLNPVFWLRDTDEDLDGEGIPLASLGISTSDSGLLLIPNEVNESDGMFYLNLNLDMPAYSDIYLRIQVSGSAEMLQQLGLDGEFRSDVSLENGATIGGLTWIYYPETGELVVHIPAGSQGGSIPVGLVDDHVNDGPKELTFTVVDSTGPIVNANGTEATVTITEDDRFTHEHGQGDESYVFDGPVVGLVSDDVDNRYPADPEGDTYSYQITLTDPHTGQPYDGYKGDGLMSQDMTITLNVGGTANVGDAGNGDSSVDYHLMPSGELLALIQQGVVSVDLNDDGSIKINADGTFNVTLHGRVDADGNPTNGPVFNLDDLGDLTFTVEMHLNGEAGNNGDGAESIIIGIGDVSGNEGQPAIGADREVGKTVAPDPSLDVDFTLDSVNESQPGFEMVLTFDKGYEPGVNVEIVLGFTSEATLWNGNDDDAYKADFFLPGTYDAASGTSSLQVNGHTVTFAPTFDAQGNLVNITVSGPAEAFGPNGELSVTFPLNDDHITELNDESIQVEIEQVNVTDGTYTGVGSGIGNNDSTVITEDRNDADTNGTSETGEKDGPIVGVELVEVNGTQLGANDNKYGADIKENEGTSTAPVGGSFVIGVTLTDPHTQNPYGGYDNADNAKDHNAMSQDMRVSVTLNLSDNGDGRFDANDFDLDLSALNALPGVSNVTVTTDANGNPVVNFTLEEGFDLSQYGDKLNIGVSMKGDDITEMPSNITVSVATDGMNESRTDGRDVSINVEDGAITGPVISIGNATVNESADNDTASTTPNHTEYHSISFSEASSEPIAMIISLSSKNANSVMFDGSNAGTADFGWPADHPVEAYVNGQWVTVAVTQDASGNYQILVPAGATEVRVGVEVYDDLREVPSEAGEGYQLKVELAETDTDNRPEWDPSFDASTGKIGSEASLTGGASSITGTITITEDARGGSLNPADFDGPYVNLSTSTNNIYESAVNPTTGQADATRATSATFTISLLDPTGNPATMDPTNTANHFTDSTEPVTVTMSITGSGTWSMADLALAGATQQSDGTWTLNIPVSPSGTGSLVIAADGQSATLVVEVPAGQAQVSFDLSALDDYYGGNTSTSNDSASESFVVQVTDIIGNEARLPDVESQGKETITIVDDSSAANNQFGSQDGPRVNVNITQTNDKALKDGDKDGIGEVTEGSTYNVNLSLTDASGNPFSIDTSHVAYNGEGAGKLQEALTVTFKLGGTSDYGNLMNGNGDYVLKFFNPSTGKYDTLPSSAFEVVGSDLFVTVTYPQGSTINADGTVNGLRVTIINDAHNEQGQTMGADGTVTKTAPQETITITVDKVEGHEAVVGNGQTVEVNDAIKSWLSITGGETVNEGGDLHFTLHLNNNAAGTNAQGSSTVLKGMTQDTTIALEFTPNTVNGAIAGGANSGDYDLTALKAAFEAQGYTNVTITINPDGSALIIFTVPGYDASNPGAHEWKDGVLDFQVPSVVDTIFEGSEGFTVTIKGVTGNDIGIATGAGKNTATGTIDDVRVDNELSITGTPVIYEDGGYGAKNNAANTVGGNRGTSSYDADKDGTLENTEGDAGLSWSVANYTVHVKTPAHELAANGGDGLVDQGFTFNVNLGSGSATYGADFIWDVVPVDANGNPMWDLSSDTGIDNLITALNNYLATQGVPGVTVTGVSNGGKTITVSVAEGTNYDDIAHGINFNVKAIDDSDSENSESYTVSISRPSQEGYASIGSEHTAKTEIVDDHGDHDYANGFRVGVGHAEANESDGVVNIPILFYGRDGHGLQLSATDNGSQKIIVMVNGVETEMWLPAGYTLRHDGGVTVTLGYDNDTATGNVDYDTNVKDFNFGAGTKWELVDLGDGSYALKGYAEVALTDDQRTEGNEDFTVTVDHVSGNESLRYVDENGKPGHASDSVTIVDDSQAPTGSGAAGSTIGQANVLDGPTVDSFGPTGNIYEPSNGDNAATAGAANTADRQVEFRITLDHKAEHEPVIVVLDLRAGGATLGADFTMGDGIYQVGGTLTSSQYSALTTSLAGSGKYMNVTFAGPDGSGNYTISSVQIGQVGADGNVTWKTVGSDDFFVVVPKGSAQADFTVNIKHDNDETSINQSGDVDNGSENINLVITDIAGNESWIKGEVPASNAEIQDDMKGPIVSIKGDTSFNTDVESDADYTVSIAHTATEDVKVYIDIKGINPGFDTSLQHDAGGYYVVIKAGDKNASFTIDPADGDYGHYFVTMGDVVGGEARPSDGFVFTDIHGKGGPGLPPLTVDLGDITVIEGDNGTKDVDLPVTITVPKDVWDAAQAGSRPLPDVTITLDVLGGKATEGTDFNVGNSFTISGSDLADLISSGKAIVDGNGNLVLDVSGLVPDNVITVIGDTLVEGDEHFNVGITDITGADVGGHPYGTVTITDDDQAYFKTAPVGSDTGVEGGSMQFEVSLVDANGNPLTISEEITVRVVIDGLTEGVDYVLPADQVTIGADGKGYVTINFPDDLLTELADKNFTVKVEEIVNKDLNTGSLLDQISTGNQINVGGKLHDDYTDLPGGGIKYENGPTISLVGATKNSITEGGTESSFIIRTDMVLQEDATVTVKLEGNLDQLNYFKADGTAWDGSGDKFLKVVDANGNAGYAKVVGDTVLVTFPGGDDARSQVWLQVTAKDDTLSESGHKITATITGTTGGETDGNFQNPANGVTVDIKDNYNGPLVVLEANQTTVEEGTYANFEINLEGRSGNGSLSSTGNPQAADEDINVTIKLNDDWQKATNGSDVIEVSFDGGTSWTQVTVTDNQFKVTVDAGDTNIKIRVPLNDSSIKDGNDDLSMSVVKVEGGESAVPSGASFTAERMGEDGFSITYHMDSNVDFSNNTDMGVSLTLTNTQLASVKTVSVYGQTIDVTNPPEGYTVTQDGANIVITCTRKSADALDTNVKVTFNGSSTDVNNYKDAMGVEMSGSRYATSTVTDDATADTVLAGISLVADTVVEGSDLAGAVNISFPNLAGDKGTDGKFHTADELTVTVQINGTNPDGTYSPLTLSSAAEALGITMDGPDANGVVTFTIPEGVEIPANGQFDIGFTVNVPDNSVTNNPSFSLTVTGITDAESTYENLAPATNATTDTVTVTDSATDSGPTFKIEAHDAVEGDKVQFNISSNSADWKDASGDITLQVKLEGLKAGDKVLSGNGTVLYTALADGDAVVDINMSSTSKWASVRVDTVDGGSGANRTITASVVGNNTFETQTSTTTNNTATVSTNDGIEFGMSVQLSADTLTYTIGLALANGYAPLGNQLTEPVTFNLEMGDLLSDQLSSIASQLDNLSNVTAVVVDNEVVVTLAQGYDLSNTNISFDATVNTDVDFQAGMSLNDGYDVALSVDDDQAGLLGLAGDGAIADAPVFNLNIEGTSGADSIIGTDGNDTIFGGLGDDTMTGGEGSDVFAWNNEDFGGTDYITDFNLADDGDRLSFGDLFATNPSGQVEMDSILQALTPQGEGQSPVIDVAARGDDLLEITVNSGANTQVVEVQLNNSLSQSVLDSLDAGDSAAKAALLQQMLTDIGG